MLTPFGGPRPGNNLTPTWPRRALRWPYKKDSQPVLAEGMEGGCFFLGGAGAHRRPVLMGGPFPAQGRLRATPRAWWEVWQPCAVFSAPQPVSAVLNISSRLSIGVSRFSSLFDTFCFVCRGRVCSCFAGWTPRTWWEVWQPCAVFNAPQPVSAVLNLSSRLSIGVSCFSSLFDTFCFVCRGRVCSCFAGVWASPCRLGPPPHVSEPVSGALLFYCAFVSCFCALFVFLCLFVIIGWRVSQVICYHGLVRQLGRASLRLRCTCAVGCGGLL